jgi:hypothetical protein
MSDETSSGGTQVTSIQPPAYQLPFLQQGTQGAANLYAAGGPEQYTGNRVVPFAPQTEAAMAGTVARATNGSPVVGAGQDYVTKSLNGGFMNQNPYLDATFDLAARRSQNRLTSEFARSGRDVSAAAPARADMLTDLATQIYGGAYENDRNRQQGVLPYVNPLAEADYRDLSALGGIGAQVEDMSGRMIEDAASRFEYEQQRPEANLDQFLRRIQGQDLGENQTTQMPDVYRNRLAGALGGGMAGSALLGPYGALIGALGGLL